MKEVCTCCMCESFHLFGKGRGVGLVKIELAAKIAPRSHKFNIRAVGRGKEDKNLSFCQHFGAGNTLAKHLGREDETSSHRGVALGWTW